MSSTDLNETVQHNLIVDDAIGEREYQKYLAEKAQEESTLIVLPTGTGKTIVNLRIMADRLLEYKESTILMLAPTKPLVEQHLETYKEFLDISNEKIVQFTGDISPSKREKIWNKSPSLVISTPQVIENDIINGRIDLKNVSMVTFDECHRATGDYSYVYIATKYHEQAKNPLVVGLSASPGDSKEKVLSICNNIGVESIEVLSKDDPRVEPYVFETTIQPRFVEISDDVLKVRDKLQDIYKKRLVKLYEKDYLDSRSKSLPNWKLRKAQGKIQQDIKKGNDDAYKSMSIWAEAMKISPAIKQVETQGIDAFLEYYYRLEKEAMGEESSKAVQRLVSDPKMKEAVKLARNYNGTYAKFEALRTELVNQVKIDGGNAIVFTKSRDTVEALVKFLEDTFTVERLVGQTNKENSKGMSHNEQRNAINRFSNDDAEVLISTQVGEEGLDISEVDLVVFYEPAQRSIEQIQRQGRTGRSSKGKVLILIGEGTRDVGAYYKSKNSIENMKVELESLEKVENLQEEIEEKLKNNKQTTLTDSFSKTKNSTNSDKTYKNIVFADSREMNSKVLKELDMMEDIEVEVKNNLEVGDYVVGQNCAIERKSVEDFASTITDSKRSLFEQIGDLSNAYENPVLIVEGGISGLYATNINRNAIRAMISSLVSDFGVSVIESIDEEDTASYLKYLASREQEESDRKINPHGNKRTKTTYEQQEYIVSSIAGIGPVTAENLLEKFGDIKSIVNADVDELKEVENIGENMAQDIHSILRVNYSQSD